MTKIQKILALAVVAFLVGGLFFWYRHYQDKQKFEQIEASLNQLSKRVEDEFGISVSETVKYCSRESRKFEQGPLNCHIAKVFSDNSINKDDITDLLNEEDDIVEATSVSFIFNLLKIDATCDVNNTNRTAIPGNSLVLECSKQATESHFQFVE